MLPKAADRQVSESAQQWRAPAGLRLLEVALLPALAHGDVHLSGRLPPGRLA